MISTLMESSAAGIDKTVRCTVMLVKHLMKIVALLSIGGLLGGCASVAPLTREEACSEFRELAGRSGGALGNLNTTSSDGALEAISDLRDQQAGLRRIADGVSQTDKMFGSLLSVTADAADGLMRAMQAVADGDLDALDRDDIESGRAYAEGLSFVSDSCREDGF